MKESRIQFARLSDMILRWRMHTEHHEDLFAGFLVPSIDEQRGRVSSADALGEMDLTYADWAKDELLVLGYVSAYHMWERHIRVLLSDQLGRLGIPMPIQGRSDLIKYAQSVLADTLYARLPDQNVWSRIDRARRISNAYKHGPGRSFDGAKALYPEHFVESGIPNDPPIIIVTRDQFSMLMASLKNFWETIPYRTTFGVA